jgi:hypothetical protein
MARRTLVSASLIAAAMLAVAPLVAGAYTYDKLTHMTFTGTVQIPGATLAPGTYRFHLANPESSRNVLQVLSDDGSVVYAMFHTIPDSRIEVTDEPTVTFKETPIGMPPAVKSLFYGGEHRGYEFVYPKSRPIVPAAPIQPEITYTSLPGAAILEPELEFVPEPETVWAEPESEPVEAPSMEPVAELPRTASPLPLQALAGLASLVAGLGIGLLRKR